MKRKISLLLVGVMVLSLTGCSLINGKKDSGRSQSADAPTKAADNDVKETTESEKAEAEEANAPDAAENATGESDNAENEIAAEESVSTNESEPDGAGEEQAVKVPSYVKVKEHYYENSGDDTYTTLYDGYDEELLVNPETEKYFPALTATLNSVMKEHREGFKKGVEIQKKDAREQYKSGYFYGEYSDTEDICIQRSDDVVLSYYADCYNYMGGAHGSYGIYPMTFDVASGTELALTDIINIDKSKLDAILLDKIRNSRPEYSDPEYLDSFGNLEDTIASYDFVGTDLDINNYESYRPAYTWYLTSDGLHFYFGIYTIASYADGATDVVIGYDEMPEIFNEKYLPRESGGFVAEVGRMYETKMDVDCDGVMENVTLDYIYENDNYDYAVGVSLKVDDTKVEYKDEYFYPEDVFKVYHVKATDGRCYIYVCTGGLDDYYEWIVFDVNDNTVRSSGSAWYCSLGTDIQMPDGTMYATYAMTDPDNMPFAKRTNMLGSFSVYVPSHVGEKGLPEANSNRYVIDYISADGTTSKKDMQLDIVDEEGSVVSTGENIPAGTRFMPLITDLETYIDARIDDGRIVRIVFSDVDYPAKVGGVEVDELFNDLMYAG